MSLRGAQSAPKQSPGFLRKRLFEDYPGPVPMVQDRDLDLPETGLSRWRSLH